MTDCVVCNLEKGYCEFCPDPKEPLRLITNRDPGDENDMPSPPSAPRAVVTHRSYKATYRLGRVFRTNTMIGFDSFADTVYLAIRNRREGEKLVGLTELT